ncbi:hypothetical protein N7474_004146 [Penicillium riverlandense]|uniref:uncharacterized protein n=1 Tax=Penicillium riverlandense TaxID=1903569 RepID=UPI002546F41E|nr:uncharacterized protein N7474_004146 [Penicillium riverlandense]KAJ5818555.1 hypothetical protein N7474_004146 [Penicillium riverlandense]
MVNFWAAACYGAFALVPAAQAITFEEPRATPVYDFDRRGGQQPPAPTNGPLLPRAIGRRTYSLSAGISYFTSTMGSEFCGYMSGQLDGGVFCNPGYDCIFHTPDAIYSGMVACCLEDGGSSACGFRSTCYNSDQISSTPALLSYSDNTFVQLCTDNTAAECVTWTYPELGVTDFQCTDTNTVIWMSTWATGITTFGSGSISGYSTGGLLEVVPISTVGDVYINEHVTGAGKQPLSSAAPAGSTPTFDVINNSTNSGGGSSVSGGAIAGAVVGSVVGVAGICAALFMFFLMRRKKNQAAAAAAGSGDKTSGAMTQETGAAPAYLPSSQRENGTMFNPSEIDGYPTNTKHRSDLSEVEGSSAIGSGNSPPVTEVEGNNTRPDIIQEMDARAEISELPAEDHR